MRMPSRRWWTNTAAASFALLAMITASDAFAMGQASTEQVAGQEAGETIRGKFGSQEALRRHILNPMASSETPLETVDGSKVFPAQLSFPSSKKFLEVFMQPGPTGDLGTVIIAEDLDFDGITDYSFQVPFPVSGVCGNGIISCTPGTWTNCEHYAWVVDDGRVLLQQESAYNLGGCYCINSDCGSNLVWSNVSVVLQDLGGGVVGAIQQANPNLAISDVKVQNMSISYYGQDTSRLTDPDTGTVSSGQPPVQTTFFYNPGSMDSEASSLASGQMEEPTSLYSLVSTFYDSISTPGKDIPCSIERIIRISEINSYCQTPIAGEILSEIKTRQFFKVQVQGSDYVIRGNVPPASVVSGTIDGSLPYSRIITKDYGCQAHMDNAEAFFDSFTPVPQEVRSGSAGIITSAPAPPTGSIDLGRRISYFSYGNDSGSCRHDDVVYSVDNWHELCTRIADVATEDIQDGCAELERDPDCSLKDEIVDSVWTYRMHNPTGLTPLASTRAFAGTGSHNLTRNWWRKDRVYFCESPPNFDLTDAKTRFGQVIGSIGNDGPYTSYQDIQKTADGWMAASGSIDLVALPKHDECEKACKTRRPKEDTQSSLGWHSGQWKTDSASYDLLYHTCVNDECPAKPGEEVLKDCQCLNEFAEAATIMQMLRLAGQDTICSDGVPKTPSSH